MKTIISKIKTQTTQVFSPIQIEYNSKQYLPAFDGWRGVGVILVMFAHFYNCVITRTFWVSMDLFFVMSGFLITGILLDSKNNPHYYRNYITRRVLRVFPLYYFALLLSLIIIPAVIPKIMGPGYDYYTSHAAWFWLYGQNWLFSITGFPPNHTLDHFWSLAVEEQFYVFWPLLIKFFDTKKILRICIFLSLFSIYFRLNLGHLFGLDITYEYVATFSRMDSLSIGAIIAILIRKNKRWLEKYTVLFAVIAAFCCIIGVMYNRSANYIASPAIYTFVDIFAGCVLLLSLSKNKPLLIRLGDARFFRFLGKYSYGLYIYHYIIYNILRYDLYPILFRQFHNELIGILIISALTIVLSLGISILSFKYLESPFLKLKKYFSYQPAKKNIPQPAVEAK